VIAAQVALVCLGFEEEGLDAVDSLDNVIVHPRTIRLEGALTREEALRIAESLR
jgi:hypothetical protein